MRTVQAALERKLSGVVSSYTAVGYLQSDEKNPVNGEKDIGVELLGEVHWTIKKSMGLDLGASYLFTGGFYKTGPNPPEPDGLYQIYLRYQLEF